MSNVWFFGVGAGESAGHYPYKHEGVRTGREDNLPAILRFPDGTLCPSGDQVEGQAAIHLIHGWTCMGFLDRSADRRGGCNANFMVKGLVDFATLKALAQAQYPRLFARFGFEVVLSGEDLPVRSP